MNPTTISVSIETTVGSGGVARVINPLWPESTTPPVEKLTQYHFAIKNVAAGNVYKIIVKGGKRGARDVNGNYLKEKYVQLIRF